MSALVTKSAEGIRFRHSAPGSRDRKTSDKLRESVSPLDVGAVGDGVADDSAAFIQLENAASTAPVDLCGKTYFVTALPTGRTYFNGFIKYSADGNTYEAAPVENVRVANTNVIIGKDAGDSMPRWVLNKGPLKAYNVFAIGEGALKSNVSGRNVTAIGTRAMYSMQEGRYNVAIGLEAQYFVNSDDSAALRGTRNTSVGDNTLRFNVNGRSNSSFGRNAGQCVTGGDFNVLIAPGTMSGDAPLALDDSTIVNNTPLTASKVVAVGVDAARWANASGSVAVGYAAGHSIKKGTITAVGEEAGINVEADCSYDGFQLLTGSKSGTYTWAGASLVFSVVAHGLSAGFRVYASVGAHEPQWLTVQSVTDDTLVIENSFSGNESGNVTISRWATNTPYTPVTDVVAIGRKAAQNAKACTNGTFVGGFAGASAGAANNTALGYLALTTNNSGANNTALGYAALRLGATGAGNSAVGYFAGANLGGDNNTALGNSALRNMQDGSAATAITNSTGVGYQAYVSGSNQVQLGNSSTTTYVYGTVQNRSDLRDKADVRDTALGLDFICRLRPVDYRWDMREDYTEITEDGEVIKHKRDGSKKRARYHHGLIAQEVKALAEQTGVEFGGLQDHAMSGGADVLSIGYDEFIAPLIKAVQELAREVHALKNGYST